MYNFFAVLIGGLIGVMLTLNGLLEGRFGVFISLAIIHLVGLFVVIILMLIKKEKLFKTKNIPLYLFSGGAIGVLLTFINILTIKEIGVALTSSIAVFGQLVFSSLIDNYGWFGMEKYIFNKKKLIGFSIILIGLVVMTM